MDEATSPLQMDEATSPLQWAYWQGLVASSTTAYPKRKVTRSTRGPLHQVLFAFLSPPPRALTADAADDHPVGFDAKAVQGGHLVTDFDQFVALKFQQFSAPRAVQVVVLGVAVIVVVDGAAVELKTIEQPGVDTFTQGAIDGGGTDVVRFPPPWQPFDQLFGVKMLVLAEHLVDQEFPLAGLPQPARLQVLAEPFLRRKRNLQRLDFCRNRFGIRVRRFGG